MPPLTCQLMLAWFINLEIHSLSTHILNITQHSLTTKLIQIIHLMQLRTGRYAAMQFIKLRWHFFLQVVLTCPDVTASLNNSKIISNCYSWNMLPFEPDQRRNVIPEQHSEKLGLETNLSDKCNMKAACSAAGMWLACTLEQHFSWKQINTVSTLVLILINT
jgi:hypothetical protein